MLSDKQSKHYLYSMKRKLLKGNKSKIELSNQWVSKFQETSGIYVVFENGTLVYVGETGNIRDRMRDLLDSRHHSLRRSIGRINFYNVKGYKNATTKKKFPKRIEKKVNNWLQNRAKISAMPIKLGRKELEEKIIKVNNPKYNKKGQRGR